MRTASSVIAVLAAMVGLIIEVVPMDTYGQI